MESLSSVGLGLSVVFGCLLLALVAELYYLFWWKKRFANREIEDGYISPAKELLYMFCWRRPSSLTQSALNPQELCSSGMRATDPEGNNKDVVLKPFGDGGVESELMMLHNLSGPPRFLFTIVEETKEDLESEDGKSRSRSLSDLLFTVETPFLTPLASPSFFTPPLTPLDSAFSPRSFNPLFESSTDAEFSRIIRSSPPPKFRFLQQAEEKLHRKKLMEDSVRDCEDDTSFITIIVDCDEQGKRLA